MQNKLKNILFILIISVLLFTACGINSQIVENETNKIDVYTIADATGDWGFPAPFTHYNRGPGYVRMSLIFDNLLWKDETGKLVGSLAEKWEYLAEEKAFLFQLRPDVKWHDGEDFTAEDVLFTFKYLKEHPYSWVDLKIVKKVEVLNKYDVKVYLEKDYAPFLTNVAGTMPILPQHIYQDIDNPLEYTQENALIGTGPFKLIDYNKEQGIYLYERNEDYYLGLPKVKQLRFIKLNEQMIPQAILRGEANAGPIPPEMVDIFKDKGYSVLVSDYNWNAKLKFNLGQEPFTDKRFRQAIAFGIDREKLVNISQRGHGLKGNPGFIPPDSPWHFPEINQYGYNTQKAKELLNEIGYVLENGKLTKDGKILKIELLTSARFSRDAELIKSDLENVGMDVEIRILDDKTLDVRTQQWSFQIVLSGHGGLGGDPEFFNRMVLGESFHSARYKSNQRLNNLLEKQVEIIDKAKRKEVLAEIQKIYAEDLPALTLYYPNTYQVRDTRVNLYYTPGGLASGIPVPLNKLSFIE